MSKTFCKNNNVKLYFFTTQIVGLIYSKDCFPVALKPYVMNRFSCAGCQSCYIGETKCHLPTKIKKQPQTDAKSHIPQHLNENPNCRDLCDTSCLIIIDQASSSFRIILKEALHITWLKAMLNKQKNHVILTKFRYNVRYLVS